MVRNNSIRLLILELRPAKISHSALEDARVAGLTSDFERLTLLSNVVQAVLDIITFARNLPCSRSALAAENLFLRKQLTFFVERERPARRTDNATRFTMATLSRLFDWKDALVVVKPETLIRWLSFAKIETSLIGRA